MLATARDSHPATPIINAHIPRSLPEPRAAAQPAPARFGFLLSPERSGSTLLSSMLGGHSTVTAPAELHLLRYPTVGEWREGYPMAASSLETLAGSVGIDPSEIDDELRPADLYARILKEASPGALLLDKTPAYARNLEALEAAETLKPVYIWLIRHPLGVASSRIQRWRLSRKQKNGSLLIRARYPAFLAREWLRRQTGESPRQWAEDWADVHARIQSFLQRIEAKRIHVVHYEDLVQSPERELGRLCSFLEIAPEARMLDPRGNAPSELRWGLGDEQVLRQEGITSSRARAWARHYSETLLSDRVRTVARSLGVVLEAEPHSAWTRPAPVQNEGPSHPALGATLAAS